MNQNDNTRQTKRQQDYPMPHYSRHRLAAADQHVRLIEVWAEKSTINDILDPSKKNGSA